MRVAAAGERQHVETHVAGDDRVRLGARAVDDAVAGRHGVGPAVLPAQPDAAEHVKELLLIGVDVHRHRPLTRGHPVSTESRPHRARRGAEALARSLQRAAVNAHPFDVVPVGQHASDRLMKDDDSEPGLPSTGPRRQTASVMVMIRAALGRTDLDVFPI